MATVILIDPQTRLPTALIESADTSDYIAAAAAGDARIYTIDGQPVAASIIVDAVAIGDGEPVATYPLADLPGDLATVKVEAGAVVPLTIEERAATIAEKVAIADARQALADRETAIAAELRRLAIASLAERSEWLKEWGPME